jgi:tRNA-binding protein
MRGWAELPKSPRSHREGHRVSPVARREDPTCPAGRGAYSFVAHVAADAALMDPLEAFATLDLRVGRIVRAEPNERAHKPAYKLWIDFGPLGEKRSSAQLRALYRAEELVGRQVIAAMNLGTRNIAGFQSEVLVLGLPSEAGEVVLLAVEREVPLGGRVY